MRLDNAFGCLLQAFSGLGGAANDLDRAASVAIELQQLEELFGLSGGQEVLCFVCEREMTDRFAICNL